jgi:hypothetical protein
VNIAVPQFFMLDVFMFTKGVEEIIPKMRVGDNFLVTIPVSAFDLSVIWN